MRTFSVLLFILLTQAAFTQNTIRQYVQQQVKAIRSINPADTNYADLEAIGKAIGDRRIVMLGELDHGDGSTFAAKSRLVKYLHKKLGFKVLAFEGDFYALNKGWENHRQQNIDVDSLVQWSIYPIWTQCKQSRHVFNYVKTQSESSNPLKLSGVDNQLISNYSSKFLRNDLESYLNESKIPFTQTAVYPRYLTLIDSLRGLRNKADSLVWDTLINNTTLALDQLSRSYSPDGFYIKLLQSLEAFCRQARYTWIHPGNFLAEVAKYRDVQMANNLKWLATVKFPGEKIIVWAHNRHIWKNDKDYYSMGYQFTRDTSLLHQAYVLGFTQYKGWSKFTTQPLAVPVIRTRNGSLEQWIQKKGYPFAFIDFLPYTRQRKRDTFFYMNTFIDKQRISDWHNVYDGIFFIEEMKPCETVAH